MIMPILAVKDVNASVAFYRDVLGFEVRTVMQGADGTDNFGIVNFCGSDFGLTLAGDAAKGGEGVVFMVYVTEDVNIDAYYEKVKAKTSNIYDPLHDEYWGDRLFTLRDADGYALSFCQTTQQMAISEIADAHKAQ